MVLKFKINYVNGGRRRRQKIEYTGEMLKFFKNNKTITEDKLGDKMYEITREFDINEVDENGNTLLHLAIEYNREIDIIKLFVDGYGAKTKRNSEGETPLYLAVKKNIDKDIINYLIDNYEVIEEEFKTYVDLYREYEELKRNYDESITNITFDDWKEKQFDEWKGEIAIKYGVKKEELEQIVSMKRNKFKKGKLEEVKENKVNVKVIDIPDNSGKTPLLLAIGQENKDIIKLLIEKGANTENLSEDNKKKLKEL